MAYYTTLKKHEIQELAARYELQLISFEPIEQGAGNSNYLVTTNQGKFILTVFEIDHVFVDNMIEVLVLLERAEFPSPRIKYTAVGDALTKFQGKPVLVKPYIDGRVVKVLNDRQLNQLGAALAKLHKLPVPELLPNSHVYIVEIYPKVLEKGTNVKYKAWLEERYQYIVKNIPSGLPRGLNHGDLFFDNVLFEGDNLKAMIDFEESCQTYRVFDLGMAVVGLCTINSCVALNKVRALVNGYQQVRKLEEKEKESLQLFIELGAALTSAWRFWKFNIDAPDEQKSQTYQHMVDIAKNIRAKPQTTFMEAIFKE